MVRSHVTSRKLNKIKCLELISGAESAFSSYWAGTIKIKFKEISRHMKKAMVMLEKINKSIKEIAMTFGVNNSTIWHILRMHM